MRNPKSTPDKAFCERIVKQSAAFQRLGWWTVAEVESWLELQCLEQWEAANGVRPL